MSIKPSSKGVVAVDVSIVLLNPAPGVELKGLQVKVSLTVEYIDQQTKATQVSQFDLVLEKNGSNWKIIE